MRVRFSQIKIVALCVSLLTMLTPTLSGCGRVCTAMYGSPPHAVLTVDNGVVYGVGALKFFALRASNGKMLWQNTQNPYDLAGHLAAQQTYYWGSPVTPVIDGQTVIETMGVGLIAALRTTDGKMLWHSQPLAELAPPAYGPLSHPPVVADGVIYDAVGYGAIAAWNEDDGHTLWVSRFASDAEAAPSITDPAYRDGLARLVVAGRTIYVNTGRSVYALSVLDGSTLWRLPDTPVGTSYSTPVVATNTVYVADSHGTVFALDSETGAIRWRSAGVSNTAVDTQPMVVVQGHTVFVESQGSLVRALNTATGAQRWRYQTHNVNAFFAGPLAPLVVEGSRVYLASLAFGMYVLDTATGQELWRAPLGNGIFNSAAGSLDLSTPAVDQGIVVLVAANGGEAWRVADGQKLWVALIPNKEDASLVQSAALAAGIVYLAQGGTQATCGFSGMPPRVLALRETDGAELRQVSI